jgi:hypothetical protein
MSRKAYSNKGSTTYVVLHLEGFSPASVNASTALGLKVSIDKDQRNHKYDSSLSPHATPLFTS